MRKILSILLVLVTVLLVPCGAVADGGDGAVFASAGEGQVATEYYSGDLLEPLEASVTPEGELGNISAKSAVLIEKSTGRILYEQNAHERLAPASITKIMSLLLVMEALEAGQFTTDTMVTASDYACSMGGSQIWLEPGEQMSVHDLLKATAVASANDATVALGELVSGTESAFVTKMNERAAQLGMVDTTFVNASGLDADGHLTSAHDIALASCELLKHDRIKEYSTIWMDTLRGGESELVNTNKLVKFYDGATGLKTGTTSSAGHCLSASAMRDGMELVAVVMGCESSKDRFNSARGLLDYGFANWSLAAITPDASALEPLHVTGGTAEQVSLTAGGTSTHLVGKGRAADIKQTLTLPESVAAPVHKNQILGEIVLTLDGEELGRIPIAAAEEVGRMTIFAAFSRLLASLFAL